jgi:Mrp family chromosome partitioning ATPase
MISFVLVMYCNKMYECELCEDYLACESDKHFHNSWIKKTRLDKIKKVVLLFSNKGGTGQTVFTSLLAAKIQKLGKDPSVVETSFSSYMPKLFNSTKSQVALEIGPNGIIPPNSIFNYKYISSQLFMGSEPKIILWDDEAILKFISKMIVNTDWEDSDTLIIDLSHCHSSAIAFIKSLFIKKIMEVILIFDSKITGTSIAESYVSYFEEIGNLLAVLMSPSIKQESEEFLFNKMSLPVFFMPFCEELMSSGEDLQTNILKAYQSYEQILEKIAKLCLKEE